MRKYLASLIASLFLNCSAAQAGFLIDSYKFAAVAPSLTFIGCTNDPADQTTYTFASHSVGAEGNRDTIVGVIARDGAITFNTSTVTVGGASAIEVDDEAGSGQMNTSLHIVDNPSGTNENIVVTMSEPVLELTICVWAAYNLNSETKVASTVADHTSAAALTLDLTSTSADGIAVGVCGAQSSSDLSVIWTGLTEQTEFQGTNQNDSSADLIPTVGGSLAITCDWSASDDVSGVAASFR